MEPSIKYKSTEKTGNGFKVKVTDDPIKTLFTLNSDTDISIAYTNTSHNEFREICQFFGSGTFNIKPYLRDEIKFSHVYQTAAVQDPPAGYVDICKLRALNFTAGKYQQTSPYIIFLNATQSSTAHNHYWYGQNEREEAANNRNLSDVYLVSDFEVNKAIFYATVRGYTKTEYDNYLATGTTVSDHDINLWDFIASPSDYYISHFGMVAQFTWNEDNSRWDSVHTNCRITPALLFNAGTAKGITNINNAYFAGTYSGSTETQISNNTAQSSRHTSRTGTLSGKSMGQLYDQIIDTSWCIGSPIDLEFDPDMLQTDWDNNNEATIAFSGNTDKKEYYTDYHYTLFGWEEYSWGYNYGTSEGVPCHCTKYEFHLQRLIKGESVSALMASCGVYVTDTSNLTTFRGYSLTPTSLKSSHIKLGEMLPDGSTSGVWINGNNLDEYTGPNKTGSIIHPDYNPTPPAPRPGPYDDDPWHGVSFSGVQVGGIGAFARCYYMTSTELQNLRSWMGSTSVPEGFDPMAQIIGLSQVPVPLSGDAPENIQFINSSAVYDPGVTSRVVDSGVASQYAMGAPIKYSLGSININRRMQERGEPYLDYSCQVELYLPLVGVFSLDTQAVMGRTIAAEAILDPVSGTLAAYAWVEKDGQRLPIAYGSTSIGVDLPVTAQQYSVARAALKQANAQLGTSLLSSALTMIAAATSSGNAAARGGQSISSGANNAVAGNAYAQSASIAASQTMLSQTGNVFGSFMEWGRTVRQLSYGNNTAISGSFGGSTAQWSYPFEAYVKIIRPRYEKPANYNHSQGVPCVQAKTIGSCTGFIQCINVDVSGITRATDLERQAIQAALCNGVYAGRGQ